MTMLPGYEELLPQTRSYIARIYKLLSVMAMVLSLMGVVTFSLFILEESFQTVMFGTWPAQDAKRWDIVKRGTDHMIRIQHTIETVNKYFGWIQPFAYISYREYANSSAFYIESLRAKAIQNAPELFVGEHVDITFHPIGSQRQQDGTLILSGASIGILCNDAQRNDIMTIGGKIVLLNGRYVVDGRI